MEALSYKIHLEPDLINFNFEGRMEVKLNSDKKIKLFSLNSLELKILKVETRVNGDWNKSEYKMDIEKQTIDIELSKEVLGNFFCRIKYTGTLNDKLVGFYRSKFIKSGKENYVAVTQFQESDARRAFPCIDAPGKKAVFNVSYLVDKNHLAISNTEIIEEKTEKRGKKYVKFAETPRMSPYLLFFAVGEFEYIESQYTGRKIRLIASPGNAKAHGEFGLDFGIKSLQFCEDYYNIKYPLTKLDLIATPDFGHGAMENWGAILFRENYLLRYEGITSRELAGIIQNVIAHEVAHQWFGNLVSPSNWKYLWLNESFATFFAYKVVNHYFPERKVWQQFIDFETSGALTADSKINTAPIEVLGSGDVGMTITNAPILYNKGGAVLRQVEAYLGEDKFKEGINSYLQKFSYDVASSSDLWSSLEEVSELPITEMMESWVMQKGHPMVNVKTGKRRITFSQSLFTYLQIENDRKWMIPLVVKLFKDEKVKIKKFMLKDREATFELDEDFDRYFVNVEATGFYRTRYPEEYYTVLNLMVRNNLLSSIESWALENDLFGFLSSGDFKLDFYLDFLEAYATTESPLSIKSIIAHIRYIDNQIKEEYKEKLRNNVRIFLEGINENIGYKPLENEPYEIASLRPRLLELSAKIGSKKAIRFAMEMFEKVKNKEKISPDMLSAVYRIAANQSNDFEWFYNSFKEVENEQEKVVLISSLCSFSDLELLEKTRDKIFTEIPLRNRITAIRTLISNSHVKNKTWKWFLANLDNFEKLTEYVYQLSIAEIIFANMEHEEDMRKFFNDYGKKRPLAEEAARIGFEYIERGKKATEWYSL